MNSQSKFTAIRKVNGGKFSITLEQVVTDESKSLNVVALMNADDERFAKSQPKARICFLTGTPAKILELYGIDAEALQYEPNEKGQLMSSLDIVEPKLLGYPLQIQLIDRVTIGNSKSPKQYMDSNGAIQVLLDAEGKIIYQDCIPVTITPKHVRIQHSGTKAFTKAQMDELVAKNIADAALVKATKQEEAITLTK